MQVGEWGLTDAQGKPIVVCENCHGKVGQMELVSVQHPFNMQWCVNCHRQNLNHPTYPASMDCLICHH